MRVEKGDRVRFLNEVGGGTVTRTEGNLVFVEDEDGFEVPAPIFEVVIVEKANQITSDNIKESPVKEQVVTRNEKVSEPEAYHEEMEEKGHDDFNPRFYLGFIKAGKDQSELEQYLINDSNYYCSYLISELREDGYMYALHQGIVEPNTKTPVDQVVVQDLDVSWDIQLILFRKGKPYPAIKPVSTSVSIKARKFYKENSFTNNDFFYQPAVLISIIKNELEQKMELLTEKETKAIIKEKEGNSEPRPAKVKRKSTPELLEIDLHIHELIDAVTGLSNGEILQIQMDKFHTIMAENIKNKGRKIVFIHGVGNGTLKTEIRKQLDRKYKGLYYQDASFREYGYGATMVIL
ncbi:DUF2027 domain-containing protein [Alkalitalea saponilacus]|uniref:Smr domain-containing protein n=1 Tax=Alkalitalea saponilacus TaxID=889453 RepID=A0A1T5CZL7_9BACT|nr:DUF2027 domain-containing protein [Alkalitalea saponilacus]ASB51191.1 DNA mismatch repair protein [Alkalitalea saponilacus]SKB64771.1 Smr domain-containing protein [Alkalitalea saponilacus]